MKDCSLFSDEVYFAAANGFGGFRSYFDKIFKSELFSKLSILKGGPGTGKSTLIYNVSKHFHSLGCKVDAILCSSDTNSLDGAIIKHNNKKIGIIDGTAPHERDAVIPGVIDELINLGENWHTEALEKERETILAINKNKKTSYKNAYNYLRISGFFASENDEIYKKHFDFIRANKSIDVILKSLQKGPVGIGEIKIKEAFGKAGKELINYNFNKNTLRIGGSEENTALFMKALSKRLKESEIAYIRYPTVFSDEITNAVETPDLAITVNLEDYDICADDFATPLTEEERVLSDRFALNTTFFKKISSDYFNEASKNHFRLEEIYKSNMDFSMNTALEKKIISRFERFLLDNKTN